MAVSTIVWSSELMNMASRTPTIVRIIWRFGKERNPIFGAALSILNSVSGVISPEILIF
jgi:hypothetical protein